MAVATAVKPAAAEVVDKTIDLESVVIPTVACVQKYGWGKKGSDSLVATIYARNGMHQIEEEKPYAELWMGTHPSGPCKILHSKNSTLVDHIEETVANISSGDGKGHELPYLLKVLSVGGALSIQAHPNKRLAQKLHADNPAAYKDDNYKPEMAVALTPFDALAGFKAAEDIVAEITRVPEFAEAADRGAADAFVKVIKGAGNRVDGLRTFFKSLMTQDAEKVARCQENLLKRLEQMPSEHVTAEDKLFLDLYKQYPGDVGCFAAYSMNKLTLQPGEALYIGANEPHAYLDGDCVEIMANSDNVVRAGLTPKFKDVDVLVEMLTYKDGMPEIMLGEETVPNVRLYRPPCKDFQLERAEVPKGESVTMSATSGPAFLLTTGGEGRVRIGGVNQNLPLYVGAIYFCHPGLSVTIENAGELPLIVFRSNINEDTDDAQKSSLCSVQ